MLGLTFWRLLHGCNKHPHLPTPAAEQLLRRGLAADANRVLDAMHFGQTWPLERAVTAGAAGEVAGTDDSSGCGGSASASASASSKQLALLSTVLEGLLQARQQHRWGLRKVLRSGLFTVAKAEAWAEEARQAAQVARSPWAAQHLAACADDMERGRASMALICGAAAVPCKDIWCLQALTAGADSKNHHRMHQHASCMRS